MFSKTELFKVRLSFLCILIILFLAFGAKIGMEFQKSPSPFVASLPLERQFSLQLLRGFLGGLRPVVADFAWIRLVVAWDRQQWFRVFENIQIATRTQPESILFWEVGAWYLAWNAAYAERANLLEPPFKRIQNERYWIDQGKKLLLEGIEFHADDYRLKLQLGILHMERTRDYEAAFQAFDHASRMPKAPAYVGRLAGNALEKTGEVQRTWDYWQKLLREAPSERDRAMIEKKIVKLKKP